MKIIDSKSIRNLEITPKMCYEWVSDAIKNEKSNVVLPAKISMKPNDKDGVFYNCMPSILRSSGVAGLKLVTRYPENIPSLRSEILLYDYDTGALKALIDGDFITTMRTGAVAAHSINLFAISGWKSIGIIGLGNTARATLLVLLSIFKDRKIVVRIKKYKKQHEDFMKRFSNYSNITFVVCDTYEETIADSDIVISAVTYFKDNICDEKYFKKGCLLVPVHTMGFQNCDMVFDKVFADDTAHVKGFKYFNEFNYFAEVSDVVNGKSVGRESDDERIIVYNIGVSMHDLYFANKIEQLLNDVPEYNLYKSEEKFWV